MAESISGSSRDDRFVQRLNFSSGCLSLDWKSFKAQFNIFKIAKKYADMNEEEKIANLLVLMGPDSVPIFNQFTFDESEAATMKNLDNVITMFDTHFEPVKNLIYERVKFNSMKQGNWSIHQFITEIQLQAGNCDYGTMKDDLVRDRIVVGVNDSKLRDYLIDIEDLTLTKCIQRAKQYVSNHEQSARMGALHDDNVDSVSRSNRKSSAQQSRQSDSAKPKCIYCSRGSHERERCPARKATCYKCGVKGHWAKAKVCRGKSEAKAEEVVTESTNDELDGLFIGNDSD